MALGGGRANQHCILNDISRDGRFVVFESDASNLVVRDTNGVRDVFVHDRVTGTTERVSLGALGEGNGNSGPASISADGRFVAFETQASNLAPGITRGGHVLVRDRLMQTTFAVTRDGFAGEGTGRHARISADGQFVAFSSPSTVLVPNQTSGRREDAFLADLLCTSFCVSFGDGCFGTPSPGPGTSPPVLQVAGCPNPSRTLYPWIKNAPLCPVGVLIFGQTHGQFPMGLDCTLQVDQLYLSSSLNVPLHQGTGASSVSIPPGVSGDLLVQAILLSPAVPLGLQTTNAMEVRIR